MSYLLGKFRFVLRERVGGQIYICFNGGACAILSGGKYFSRRLKKSWKRGAKKFARLACRLSSYTFSRTLYTEIGRKNETDCNICNSVTSYLGHPKPSFPCVRKLFTIINILSIENQIQDVPKLFERVLQMVLCLIFMPISVATPSDAEVPTVSNKQRGSPIKWFGSPLRFKGTLMRFWGLLLSL